MMKYPVRYDAQEVDKEGMVNDYNQQGIKFLDNLLLIIGLSSRRSLIFMMAIQSDMEMSNE